jgi:hypothetical protein
LHYRSDILRWHGRADLIQRLQVISALAFRRVAISACVFLLAAAIIFHKQLIEEHCIPIGKAGLANDATNLNQKSQFLIPLTARHHSGSPMKPEPPQALS